MCYNCSTWRRLGLENFNNMLRRRYDAWSEVRQSGSPIGGGW